MHYSFFLMSKKNIKKLLLYIRIFDLILIFLSHSFTLFSPIFSYDILNTFRFLKMLGISSGSNMRGLN